MCRKMKEALVKKKKNAISRAILESLVLVGYISPALVLNSWETQIGATFALEKIKQREQGQGPKKTIKKSKKILPYNAIKN